jgi:hypothetical protein
MVNIINMWDHMVNSVWDNVWALSIIIWLIITYVIITN